jgi:hypothetical protein
VRVNDSHRRVKGLAVGHAQHSGQVAREGTHQTVGAVLNIPGPEIRAWSKSLIFPCWSTITL